MTSCMQCISHYHLKLSFIENKNRGIGNPVRGKLGLEETRSREDWDQRKVGQMKSCTRGNMIRGKLGPEATCSEEDFIKRNP